MDLNKIMDDIDIEKYFMENLEEVIEIMLDEGLTFNDIELIGKIFEYETGIDAWEKWMDEQGPEIVEKWLEDNDIDTLDAHVIMNAVIYLLCRFIKLLNEEV